MTTSISHFLLTRFNVPLELDSSADKPPGRPGPDEKRLARRFDLFERICLASVARQTEKNFRWLVFLDWATPVAFKERMAALSVRYLFLEPVYGSQFTESLVLEEIRRRESVADLRITTRLDNDDAIHPRLVEQVQELARKSLPNRDAEKGFFISFPNGCSVRGGDFYVRRDPYNSFISFVSRPVSDRTVLGCGPCRMTDEMPVVFRFCRPMWCRVIHGGHAADPLRGIYWPWGGCSEFALAVQHGQRRSVVWQVAEEIRTAFRSVLSCCRLQNR